MMKITFLNGKSILAKAYPAIAQKMSWAIVVTTVDMKVFRYTCPKGSELIIWV